MFCRPRPKTKKKPSPEIFFRSVLSVFLIWGVRNQLIIEGPAEGEGERGKEKKRGLIPFVLFLGFVS